MLTNLKTILAACAVAAAVAGNANAAGYMKFDGVDGEAKAASCAEQAQTADNRRASGRPSKRADQNADAQCATAYGKDGKKGGNVEFEWKVEEGES